jgi:UDP-MurNAc hydroxylase
MSSYGRIDFALLPYSGGSGYPSCYVNLTEEEKLREKQRIIELRLASFVRTAKVLNPRYIMPFADQYVVSGSRAHLNKYISHPPCAGVVAAALEPVGLQDRLILLNSGQAYDFDQNRKMPEGDYLSVNEADREAYIATTLRDKRYDHEKIQFNPSVSLDRLVQYARSRLWTIQQRKKSFPDYSFCLDCQDTRQRFLIRLDEEFVKEVGWDQPPQIPYLRISGSNSLMIMLLLGHISWNIADAALFLDYERVPNSYDPNLYVFLNYLRI